MKTHLSLIVGVITISVLVAYNNYITKKSETVLNFENVVALASAESNKNGSAQKNEVEESWTYTEIHGECLFTYSVITKITECYGTGRVECSYGMDMSEPKVIDIDCSGY